MGSRTGSACGRSHLKQRILAPGVSCELLPHTLLTHKGTVTMMTTAPEAALAVVQKFVEDERVSSSVKALWEDADDYFAVLASDGPVIVGEAFIFVSKKTGKLWQGSVDRLDKIDGMQPVDS